MEIRVAKKISEMKTACAYVRVSTDKQEELSPDAQKRLLLDYAKKNNISVLKEHIFLENGISGKKADKRPEFMRMIGMAKSKEHPFDIILVWKFSRFARNQEESIVYKSLLKKNSVEVVSVSEPLVDGPFGSLIERIIEWMDEYYSIRLSGEVIRGMTEKAMRGGYQSTLPLGYRMNKETKIPYIIDNEAAIIKKIYNEYSVGGKSYLEIARELNQCGYKTKRGRTYEERTVRYILENPFYIGKIRWNRQKKDDHTIRDKSEWIISDAMHDAIITEEEFDLVQAQIAKRSRPYKAHSTGSIRHWLSGIVKCSACGASLMSSTPRTSIKSFNFQCGNYNKGSCHVSHYIKTEKLEQAVYTAFKNILNTDDITFELRTTGKSDTTNDTELIKAQLKKIEDKERRIKLAYRDGIDTLEEYKENKQLLANEKRDFEIALTNVKSEPDNKAEMKREIKNVYEIIVDETQDIHIRANALRSVVDKIVYDKPNDELHIYFYLLKG